LKNLIRGAQLRRDVKLAEKRGRNMTKLREVILLLAGGQTLPPRHCDHPRGGEGEQYRDCRIEPDWLMICRVEAENLYLVRTGSHSQLF
jgi:mRNA interferase YafQ